MTQITIRGNLTAPPELRYTANGKPVASVTVAENVGRDEQKRTNFHRVTLWGELAEHASTLEKGTSVIVVGRLDESEFKDRDGNPRRSWEVTADAFGPDLRFQTAQVTRAAREGSQGARSQVPASDEPWATPQAAQPDAWAQPKAAYGDDTPF